MANKMRVIAYYPRFPTNVTTSHPEMDLMIPEVNPEALEYHPQPDGNTDQGPSPQRPSHMKDLATLTQSELVQLNNNMIASIQDRDNRPLMSAIQPMLVLRDEYESAPGFVKRIDWLISQGWIGIRRAKGDGDCFYRAFAFAWVERVLRAADQELAVAAAVSTLHTTYLGLADVGFDAMVYEDFYEILRSLVENVITPMPSAPGARHELLNTTSLLEAFTIPETSNSIVAYMRLLASAEIRKAPDDVYAPFLTNPDTLEPMPVSDFCSTFVEAIGKEADHVQMQALSRVLGVNLQVAYLDGRSRGGDDDDVVEFVPFDNGGGKDVNGIKDVVLLYRPGHYDILEPREHEEDARQSTFFGGNKDTSTPTQTTSALPPTVA